MLKIRYDLKTKLLSGWTDNKDEFDLLKAREGEAVEVLDLPKPDSDDYEYFAYDGKLISSGKPKPAPTTRPPIRDLASEIGDLKTRVEKLEEYTQSSRDYKLKK